MWLLLYEPIEHMNLIFERGSCILQVKTKFVSDIICEEVEVAVKQIDAFSDKIFIQFGRCCSCCYLIKIGHLDQNVHVRSFALTQSLIQVIFRIEKWTFFVYP